MHVDNNDAWVCAEIANLQSDDNGCEKPESDVDTTCGEDQGELQDNLFFTIWKDDGEGDHACNNILDTDETALVSNQKATAGMWPIADSTNGSPLEGGTTHCLGVGWNVPLVTGNEIQTDSLLSDVKFSAVQSRNMDNFKCSDLYTEICGDGKDNDYDGEIDEGCIVDGDGDGVPDEIDNCPTDYNSDQMDADSDGLGDVCDPTPQGEEESEVWINEIHYDNVGTDQNEGVEIAGRAGIDFTGWTGSFLQRKWRFKLLYLKSFGRDS